MKIKIFLDKIIKIILIIILAISITNIFIIKDNLIYEFNNNMILMCTVIYFVILFGVIVLGKKVKKETSSSIRIILMMTLCIVQVFYGVLIQRILGSDVGIIYFSAQKLSTGTMTNVEYFSIYNNNIFLLLFFEILFRILNFFNLEYYITAQIILNIIIIDIAIIFMQKICRKLFGEKYSLLSLILAIPLIGITPYIAQVYSDTLSLIFPIMILYNYIRYKENNAKLRYVICISLFTIVGILIKPTNIIIFIAILIIEFINMIFNLDKEKIKKTVRNVFVSILIILVIYNLYILYRDIRLEKYLSKEHIEKNSFPYTHFIMMGLPPTDIEGEYYGMYYAPDFNATYEIEGMDEKKDYNVKEIEKRLKKIGFSGYIKYLYNKCIWFMSDGTFYNGREEFLYMGRPTLRGSIAENVQDYSYYRNDGYMNYTINIMQSYWGFLLLLAMIGIIINLKKEDKDELKIVNLSVIGIVVFLLLFEARSRQLINHIPMFIILAIYTIKSVLDIIEKRRAKNE